MIKHYLQSLKAFVLSFLFIFFVLSGKSQNLGFEAASASPPANWSATSGTWNVSNTVVRTGAQSMSITDPATTGSTIGTTAAFLTTTTPGYLITLGWGRASTASNGLFYLGYRSGTTNTLNPTSTTTGQAANLNNTSWSRIVSVSSSATIAAGSYGASLRAFRTASSPSTIVYIDDIITYSSASATPDLTAPNAATNGILAGNQLSWTNGTDNGSPASGIGGVVILRADGAAQTAPSLNDQAMYSTTNGAAGVGSFVNGGVTWTVVGTINNNTTTTFTDASAGAGPYTYVMYMRDMAYNYSPAYTFTGTPCSGPIPGSSTVNPSAAQCASIARTLNLVGNGTGSGQTYRWLSSPTQSGTYTYVSSSSSSPSLVINPTSTLWYKAEVTCSGNTLPSDPVEVLVNTSSFGGTFDVGSGGTYTTLTAAINAYNNACSLSGPVVYRLTNASYSAGETFPIIINSQSTASVTNTLTIRPATGNTAVISGSVASGALISLNGADYVTIDGSNSGGTDRSLTITNTNTTSPTGISLVSAGTGQGATNNTLKNLVISTSASGAGYGISAEGATQVSNGADNDNLTIQNNSISGVSFGIYAIGTTAVSTGGLDNLNIDKNIISINTTVASIGIQVGNAINSSINQNDISVETSGASSPVGISLETGFISSTVTKNIIRKSLVTNTGGWGGRGITIGTGSATSDLTVTNNVIYGVNGTNFTAFGNSSSAGIAIGILGNTTTLTTTTGGIKLYHNSVNLTGEYATNTSTTANKITTALYIGSGASALDIRNNVFSNSLNNINAAAKAYAVYSAAANTAFTTINYNDYYTGGTQGVLGFLTSDRADITAWRTATGQDVNSISSNPFFNGSTNLIPQPNSSLIGSGTGIATVTTDINGISRNATAPNIGAYETTLDAAPPAVSFTPLATICNTGDRTFTATVIDATGVPTTGPNVPRIYYRKGTSGSWSSTAGTLSSGTATNGTWSFTIESANLPALQAGNTVYYYIMAQDVASTPNVGSTPSGAVATDVQTVTTSPSAPNSYLVAASLGGSYTVGAGGAFSTFTQAVNAYETACLTGAVVFNLTDATYSTGETFPIVINSNVAASAINTLTIKPSTNNSTVISGSAASGALLKINGADFITIDGSNNGGSDRSLTVTNTSTTSPAGVAVISLGTGLGATNNTIKNLIINTLATAAGYGITVGGSTNASTGADNDNVTLQNNSISGVSVGIYAIGTTAVSAGGNDNLNINRNIIDINTSTTGNIGIQVGNGLSSSISQNDISVETSSTGAQVGISIETGFVSSTISRNFIRKVVPLGAGGYGGRGITVGTGTATSDLTIANNVIYGMNGSNWTSFGNSSSMGIAIGMIGTSTTITTTAGGIKIYNNSVNLYGDYANTTSTTASKLTAALYIGTGASALDIRNNVFSNSMNNPAAAAKAYAIYSAVANTVFTTINNNDYYVSGTQGVLGFLTSDRADIAAWRTASGQDVNSTSANPNFNSNTVLVPQAGSPLVGAGQTIAAVTVDIQGITRNNPPTIGAYENAGDGLAPVITYTALPFTCSTGDRTLSGVTITDGTGVPTTGALLPRIYYRKGNGSWFSQPGTLTSGTGTNGTWSFQIVAADMLGVAVGNSVSYYIVAQDLATVANIGSSPAGVTATDVNTILTAPTTPNVYTINNTLNGNYNVGGGGAYSTITSAVNDYNAACLTGAVTFILTDAGYNTNESFPLVINANPYASVTNTLTIKPASNTSVAIKGTSGATASALIKLNGADYVIIDGVHDAAGTNLTIENTSITGGTAGIWLASSGAGQGATNNTIKNVTIKGGAEQSTTTTTTYGIVIAGSTLNATITTVAAGDDNDNNTIDTCTISKVRYGIYVRGGTTSNPNLGTIIKRNVIGSSGFGADEIGKAGIVIREEDGIQIRNNEIRFVGGDFSNNPAASATARAGIALATDATWTPTSVYVKNAQITANIIHDIQDEKIGAAIGIIVSGADGTNTTNNIIANNFIYNIKSNGTTSPNQAVGIGVAAGNTDKVAFNSIYMTGNANGSTGATATTVSSFGIRVSSTSASNLSVLNNIVYMDLIAGAASLKNFCIDIPTGYAWGTGSLDYNNWFANPANNQSGTGSINNGATATQYFTLATWQSASGKDANSKEVDPQFLSATDLHLQPSSPLDGQGSVVSGIITDIDNQARDVATPDIGADELPPATGLDIKPQDLVSPVVTSKGCYTTAETVTISIKNNGSSTVNFAGTPVTVNVSISGATTFNYPAKIINTGTLAPGAVLNVPISTAGTELDMSAPGVYQFNISTLATGDVNTANDAMQETRTTEALTVGSTSASPTEYCAVGGKPVLTSTGSNGYSSLQWMESSTSGSGFVNIAGGTTTPYTIASNITQTMFYKLVAKCGVNTDESGESVVVLNNYQPLTTAPASRCGVGTVTLGATANSGLLINWYANPTGGAPLNSGTSFTTPTISTSTNYYVGVGTGTTTSTGLAAVSSNPTSGAGTTNFGLVFDVLSAFTLKAVTIYPISATGVSGTVTIDVINSAGTVVHTKTVNVVGSPIGSPQPQVVTLDFNLAPGTNYKMRPARTGITGLAFEPAAGAPGGNYGYPFVVPGVVSINTSTLTAAPTNTANNDLYYYFYNWQVSTGCEGVRVPITATVTNPPVLTITPSKVVCNNVTQMLEVTSTTANFDSYIWSPSAGLYTDAAGTIAYTGTSATQVYVKGVAGTYNYTLTATNTTTTCVNVATTSVTIQPSLVTVAASPSDICVSGTSTLTASPSTGYGANSIQWQSSPDGIASYTNIASATNSSYTTPTLTATTYYKFVVKDGAGATCTEALKTIVVNNPQITGTTPATRCGNGTVALSATAAGGTINWYTSASGGVPVATGNNFTTPVLSNTTTYYVSASAGAGGVASLGRTVRTDLTANTNTNSGLVFSAPTGGTLQSVSVYPSGTGAGTLTVTLKTGNAAGATVLASTTVNITGVTIGSATKTVVPLNFAVPPGSNYYLSAETFTGGLTGLGRELTGGGPFPYTSPNSDWQITGSYLTTGAPTTTTYYYFYDWQISTGCESNRTAVVATVTPGPALTATANKTICNSSIHPLSVTSTLSDFDSYIWSPITGLYSNAAATIPYTGGSASTVYVKTATPGSTTYTLTATNTVSGCGNVASSVVTVMPNPTVVATAEICVSGTTTLSVSPLSGYGDGTFQWQSSPDGISPYTNIATAVNTNYTTPTLTQNGYYAVVLKDGAGTICIQALKTAVVNTPQIVGTTPGSRCGTGSVSLGATGTGGTTLNWYTAATGGSPIGTGTTFSTPSISSTTTYYVSAAAGSGSSGASPILVTEMDLGTDDRLEIQNVSPSPVDVTGWKIAVSDNYTNINTVNANVQTLSGIMNPGDIKTWTDATAGPNYWGSNILWNPGASPSFSGWAAIIDNNNNLVDIVFLNWSSSAIQGSAIVINGTTLTIGSKWSGNGIDQTTVAGTQSVSRQGSLDNNTSADFSIINISVGTTNAGMTIPFNGFTCTSNRTSVLATVNNTVTNATILAGTSGGTQVCSGSQNVATTNNYFDNCNLIATIAPGGAAAVSGNLSACVKIDNTVPSAPNGQKYVQRYFEITPSTNRTTATSAITLYFTQAEFNAYNAAVGSSYPSLPSSGSDAAGIANLRISQFNHGGVGTDFSTYPAGVGSIIDPTDASITYDAAANNGTGRWAVTFNATGSGAFYAHTGNNVLPVTVTNFKGELAGSINKLYWSTSTETNNKGFELERSIDGINYTKLTFVATKANGGNSTSQLSYNFDDLKAQPGTNYYRLKQIDNDGKFNYSGVVVLSRKITEITLSKVFPNPATTELNVVITSPRAEKITVLVTDLTGKVVIQTSTSVVLGENQQQLNVAKLAGGTYMVKVICGNGCETAVHRFVKQ